MIHNNKKNMVLRKTKEIVMNYDDETVKGRKTQDTIGEMYSFVRRWAHKTLMNHTSFLTQERPHSQGNLIKNIMLLQCICSDEMTQVTHNGNAT